MKSRARARARTPLAAGRDWARRYPAVAVRRARSGGAARWVDRVPKWLRDQLDLDGAVVRPLRVEIGGGDFPTPGFVHVDQDRRASHLEYVAPAWDLPFADRSVEEILAVHILEHVHPARVDSTLREWRRVLSPGGFVQAHVPNVCAISAAFATAPTVSKWALSSALLGMGVGPDAASGEDIPCSHEPDHRVSYDADLLTRVFLDAGFVRVEELTGQVGDRHTAAWAPLMADISLVVRAWTAAAAR